MNIRKTLKSLAFVLACAASLTVNAAQNRTNDAEARQMVEDTSPKAQYNRSRKEANAAYQEALADCQKMRGSEHSDCTKEAKKNLQNDLAEAKRNFSGGQSGSDSSSQ